MNRRERIQHGWYTASRPPLGARVLSHLYGGLSAARRALYRRGILSALRLPAPVVVVGNLAVGGTGKTPLTLWLAERLLAAGRRPGIACRAYAASATSAGPVSTGDDPGVKGDEAVLMATRALCPVWSGPKRAEAAAAMVAAHPEIDLVLCDDGLQHYALVRDVEIAVIDGARGFGNGWLLPAGPLRESPQRLCSVDAIVINGEGNVEGLPPGVPRFEMRLCGRVAVHVGDAARTLDPQTLRGRRVAAVAGIGNPDRFFRHLQSLGIEFSPHPFPDHHRYVADDLRRIEADCVLMTQKDAIKCAGFRDDRLWMIPVAAEVDAALLDRILERIGDRRRTSGPPLCKPQPD